MHLVLGEPDPLSVTWKHPFKQVFRQSLHGLGLPLPRVPAVVTISLQPLPIPAPPEMITSEQESILKEQAAVPARVSRRGNRQKIFAKWDWFQPIQHNFRIRLRGQFRAMNHAPGSEMRCESVCI